MSSLRSALERPLTSYYLLLGASALLLTIGLIMVLSASSVRSYELHDGDSYAIVKRQLMWVAIGVPAAWLASRMGQRSIRALAWPALVGAGVLLALTQTGLGRTVNGNTNWLALGPIQIQPSEIAKLAIVLWAAHIYARKQQHLGRMSHILVPVVPGIMVVIGLVVLQR
ncbi:MAG: FtsW/RodA/SpoVE family cell cycle protein, partial [Nocardioides sp.]|nr:FtsW/RodA/SpoVE family cell cycle protein [Nocardioides sp.]